MDELAALRTEMRRESVRPKFVLAHLPVPHWPLVLAPDCRERQEDANTAGTLARGGHPMDPAGLEAYRGQTACTDRLLGDVVKELVDTNPDAVVVVFSDHGPDERLDWGAPDQAGIKDRLANLFWARTPAQDERVFPDRLTLVNVVPRLSNAYFGTALPLHADDRWFGPARRDLNFHLFSDSDPSAHAVHDLRTGSWDHQPVSSNRPR
jgi:hypothetical protein